MAKSLRSKSRRKNIAMKRIRYAAKELAMLKKTLGIDKAAPSDNSMDTADEAQGASDQVIFLDAREIKKSKEEKKTKKERGDPNSDVSSDEETIVVDAGNDKKRIFNTKTLRDQHGQLPGWMSKRKIVKLGAIVKKKKKVIRKIRRRH